MWEWFINSGAAASTLLLGTTSAVSTQRARRGCTVRITINELSDRVVDDNPLLVKACVETLNELTFYAE